MEPNGKPLTTMRSGACRDERWFEDVFRRHHGAIRAYAARRHPAETDDVVAEVFAVAWRKREEIPEHVLPWLYGVAFREVLHTLRQANRQASLHRRLAGQAADVVPDGATAVADRIAAQGPVNQALDRLPERDAEVLRLWAWEQLEPSEIATVLGVSSVASRVRLHRARKRFGAVLAAQARNPPERAPRPPTRTRPRSLPLTLTEYSHD